MLQHLAASVSSGSGFAKHYSAGHAKSTIFYFKCIFVQKAQKRVLQKVNPSKNHSKFNFDARGTEIVPIDLF
jgi:hypothetical protein